MALPTVSYSFQMAEVATNSALVLIVPPAMLVTACGSGEPEVG